MSNATYTLEGTHRHNGKREVLHTFASKEDAMLWDNDPILNKADVYIVGFYWKDVTLKCHVPKSSDEFDLIEAW